jgi:hypothetical protein
MGAIHSMKVEPTHQEIAPHASPSSVTSQEEEPQQRTDVAEDAVEEIDAAHRVPAFGKEQPEVLDVPLAPAAVTFEHVHQRGRPFLVAAAGGGQQRTA